MLLQHMFMVVLSVLVTSRIDAHVDEDESDSSPTSGISTRKLNVNINVNVGKGASLVKDSNQADESTEESKLNLIANRLREKLKASVKNVSDPSDDDDTDTKQPSKSKASASDSENDIVSMLKEGEKDERSEDVKDKAKDKAGPTRLNENPHPVGAETDRENYDDKEDKRKSPKMKENKDGLSSSRTGKDSQKTTAVHDDEPAKQSYTQPSLENVDDLKTEKSKQSKETQVKPAEHADDIEVDGSGAKEQVTRTILDNLRKETIQHKLVRTLVGDDKVAEPEFASDSDANAEVSSDLISTTKLRNRRTSNVHTETALNEVSNTDKQSFSDTGKDDSEEALTQKVDKILSRMTASVEGTEAQKTATESNGDLNEDSVGHSTSASSAKVLPAKDTHQISPEDGGDNDASEGTKHEKVQGNAVNAEIDELRQNIEQHKKQKHGMNEKQDKPTKVIEEAKLLKTQHLNNPKLFNDSVISGEHEEAKKSKEESVVDDTPTQKSQVHESRSEVAESGSEESNNETENENEIDSDADTDDNEDESDDSEESGDSDQESGSDKNDGVFRDDSLPGKLVRRHFIPHDSDDTENERNYQTDHSNGAVKRYMSYNRPSVGRHYAEERSDEDTATDTTDGDVSKDAESDDESDENVESGSTSSWASGSGSGAAEAGESTSVNSPEQYVTDDHNNNEIETEKKIGEGTLGPSQETKSVRFVINKHDESDDASGSGSVDPEDMKNSTDALSTDHASVSTRQVIESSSLQDQEENDKPTKPAKKAKEKVRNRKLRAKVLDQRKSEDNHAMDIYISRKSDSQTWTLHKTPALFDRRDRKLIPHPLNGQVDAEIRAINDNDREAAAPTQKNITMRDILKQRSTHSVKAKLKTLNRPYTAAKRSETLRPHAHRNLQSLPKHNYSGSMLRTFVRPVSLTRSRFSKLKYFGSRQRHPSIERHLTGAKRLSIIPDEEESTPQEHINTFEVEELYKHGSDATVENTPVTRDITTPPGGFSNPGDTFQPRESNMWAPLEDDGFTEHSRNIGTEMASFSPTSARFEEQNSHARWQTHQSPDRRMNDDEGNDRDGRMESDEDESTYMSERDRQRQEEREFEERERERERENERPSDREEDSRESREHEEFHGRDHENGPDGQGTNPDEQEQNIRHLNEGGQNLLTRFGKPDDDNDRDDDMAEHDQMSLAKEKAELDTHEPMMKERQGMDLHQEMRLAKEKVGLDPDGPHISPDPPQNRDIESDQGQSMEDNRPDLQQEEAENRLHEMEMSRIQKELKSRQHFMEQNQQPDANDMIAENANSRQISKPTLGTLLQAMKATSDAVPAPIPVASSDTPVKPAATLRKPTTSSLDPAAGTNRQTISLAKAMEKNNLVASLMQRPAKRSKTSKVSDAVKVVKAEKRAIGSAKSKNTKREATKHRGNTVHSGVADVDALRKREGYKRSLVQTLQELVKASKQIAERLAVEASNDDLYLSKRRSNIIRHPNKKSHVEESRNYGHIASRRHKLKDSSEVVKRTNVASSKRGTNAKNELGVVAIYPYKIYKRKLEKHADVRGVHRSDIGPLEAFEQDEGVKPGEKQDNTLVQEDDEYSRENNLNVGERYNGFQEESRGFFGQGNDFNNDSHEESYDSSEQQ